MSAREHQIVFPCPYEGCDKTLAAHASVKVIPDRKRRMDITLTVGKLTEDSTAHLYVDHDNFDMFLVEDQSRI